MQLSPKLRYLIACVYISFISILFCLPGSAFPKNDWFSKVGFDKWVHIGIFLFLTTICCWAFDLFQKKQLILVSCIAILYGITIEFVQRNFIPNRSFDLGDWGADIIGVVLGMLICTKVLKK